MAFKKGFFPWIKSIFHKEEEPQPIDLVYNGPEIKKNPEKPVIKKRPVAECVYAGPEYFNESRPFTEKVYAGPEYSEKKAPPTEEPPEIPPQPVDMPVYAGPEYFNGNDPQNPPAGAFFTPSQEEDTVPEEEPVSKELYAAPEYLRKLKGDPEEPEKPDANDDPVFEEVYAGPEFYKWDPNGTPEEDAPLPPDEEERPIDLVYAGPTIIQNDPPEIILVKEMPAKEDGAEDADLQDSELPPPPQITPPSPLTMCVYAGPEFFNGGQTPGAYMPDPAQTAPEIPKATVTPEGMVKCPACGLNSPDGSKFCCECGMPLKTGE